MAIQHGNLSVHQVSSDKELYDIWPKIRAGINAIEKRCKGIFYRPEDVYHEIKCKRATLLIGTISNKYQGFAIINSTQYPDGQGMHIWTMHNAEDDPEFVNNFFKVIDQIATLSGVVRVTFSSSRRGWQKKGLDVGYRPTATTQTYERDINNEQFVTQSH